MMLNKTQFKQDLKAAFIEARDNNGGEDAALDVFTDRLADVLIKHMKTIEIIYTNGLAAGSSPVTGTLNHTVK